MTPPSPPSEQGMMMGPATTLSANLHQVGDHFIESISEVDPAGRWGNGAEEAPYSSDSENMTLSEMVSSSRLWRKRTETEAAWGNTRIL